MAFAREHCARVRRFSAQASCCFCGGRSVSCSMSQFDLGDELSMPNFLGDGRERPGQGLGDSGVAPTGALPQSSSGAQLDLPPAMVGVVLGGDDAGADGPVEQEGPKHEGRCAKFSRRGPELLAFARQSKRLKQQAQKIDALSQKLDDAQGA